MSLRATVLAAVLLPSPAAADLETSLRPQAKPAAPSAVTAPAQSAADQSAADQARETAFRRWIDGFRPRARARGISDATLSAAFRGVRYDADVIRRDRNQAEFTKTIWDYLDSAVSESRVANGRAALEDQALVLSEIEARYGVPREIVTAVWGLESAYGAFRGKNNVIESLATLAFDGRRGAFFEDQLLAALKILQNGDVRPEAMTGSWAGAMGHTQFIPTSYEAYAVDFRGDGKRDIWSDDPTDALASTAAYLARHGWVKGQPWGMEVILPEGFDFDLTGERITRSAAQWNAMGVRDIAGRPLPDHGAASIRLPGGARGAAFLTFQNFKVIERYNTADAYVIGVGHLADRIAGGPPIQAAWPREDRALAFAERQELQRRLTAAGFDTQGIDGKIGPNTIAAVKAYQRTQGLPADGYASLDVLQRLR